MFTGIVTDIGRVRSIRDTHRDRRFEIETTFDMSGIRIGASISHAGCCLTVVEKGADWFAVEVSDATLAATTLSQWVEDQPVNLERAARVGDELGGHFVTGHVDGIGEVVSVIEQGGSHRLHIRAPRPLHRYIASKGSVAVDGVSLTVNEIEDDVFSVNIIPHTWEATTLGRLRAGSSVNLEIDLMARYLARWQETAARVMD
jgi:riboflavin synthase